MSTFTCNTAECRPPSLDNLTDEHWQSMMQLAFVFARHVRHDLANVHCAVQLLEVVEQIETEGDKSVPLPTELQPEALKQHMRTDLRRVVSMSHDLVLLNQAASPAAYEPTESTTLGELLDMAIFDRLGDHIPEPNHLLLENDGPRLVTMGDMLAAAIGTFYFQWTPWVIEHKAAARSRIKQHENVVELIIPADDKENVAGFARLLCGFGPSVIEQMLENALSISTTQFAFWLAKHIVETHGGKVTASENDPDMAIHVMLPTA